MSSDRDDGNGTLFADAIGRLDEAGNIAGLEPEVVQLLRHP